MLYFHRFFFCIEKHLVIFLCVIYCIVPLMDVISSIAFRVIFFEEYGIRDEGEYSGKLIQIRLYVITDLHKKRMLFQDAKAAHDRNVTARKIICIIN